MQCRLWRMIDRLHPTRSTEPLFPDWTARWNWSLRRQMKSFMIHSVIHQSPSWLILTQSPTRLYLGQFKTISLSLPATGWVAEVEVLWATLKSTNETTSVCDRITGSQFTGLESGVLSWLGHEVEPSQLKCFTILLTTFTSPIVTNCNLIHLTASSNTTP